MNTSIWSGAARWLLLSAAVLAVACSDSDLGVDPLMPEDGDAAVSIFVPVGALSIGQLSVEVSAADMETLYFNLAVEDGVAAGTLTLLSGSARTITLRAFDHAGAETHRGSTTVDIVEGENPAVALTLDALGEGDPLTGIVGEYHIQGISADWLWDDVWFAYVGHRQGSVQLATEVLNANGDPIDVPIHWAGEGVDALGLASAPEWPEWEPTMATTITALAGTQATQVDLVFQNWGTVEPASTVDARFGHTCAIRDDGQLFCWGRNLLAPTHIAEGLQFTSVATGQNHSCAVAEDGSAWCWGAGADGQLGDGNATSSTVPVRVASDEVFLEVAVGAAQGYSSCGLTDIGEIWCWGTNFAGQLGDGTFDPSPVPVRAQSEETFYTVEMGLFHVCALTIDDDAYCWGNNFNGKVGNATTTNQSLPVPVAGGHKFAQLVPGGQITCGLTLDSELYCWGWGTQWYGGGNQPVHVPTDLVFESITIGGADAGHHLCGIANGDEAYCMGSNYTGQLGNGTFDDAAVPTLVAGGLSVASIDAGEPHTCATTTGGEVYCWGRNLNGQLGNLSRDVATEPVRVANPTP